jgi:hypothetical protein
MRFLVCFCAAILLVVTGIGGMAVAKAADRDARNAVMGRQQIRAELSAALAKGHLTRMDQYRILLHAKEVLSDNDLHGFEQTLDRIAVRQASTSTVIAARADSNVQTNNSEVESEVITPSKYEEIKPGEIAAESGIGSKKSLASGSSPFVEEVPAGIGKPSIHLDGEIPEGCGCESNEGWSRFRLPEFDFTTSVDGFKGPIDLGNANGNFGVRFGANMAVPLFARFGVALQAGTAIELSNLKGSPYPEPNATIRDQIFTTVGMFQRFNRRDGAITWGFAYDWLFDDYYANFRFGQWRVKGAWECDDQDEIGILTTIPEHGSSGTIPNFIGGVDEVHFKPITQGYLYWKHTWCNDTSVTGKFGLAERPGEFLFGAESQVPLTKSLALTGDFTYILPNATGGAIGQTQEIWNLSFGIEIVPGGFGRCTGRYNPFLPVADNGSLAVRELAQ